MSKSRFWATAIAILLCAVIFVTPALAVAIDGIFTDWASEASMVDSGGQMMKTRPIVQILPSFAPTRMLPDCFF